MYADEKVRTAMSAEHPDPDPEPGPGPTPEPNLAAGSTPSPATDARLRSGKFPKRYICACVCVGKVIRKLYAITTCLFNILGNILPSLNTYILAMQKKGTTCNCANDAK